MYQRLYSFEPPSVLSPKYAKSTRSGFWRCLISWGVMFDMEQCTFWVLFAVLPKML